jgi:hypothetical protein
LRKHATRAWHGITNEGCSGVGHSKAIVQVTEHLGADLTPLARRFWAPAAAAAAGAPAPVLPERCARMLPRLHAGAAAALWDVHPVATSAHVPLSRKLAV